MDNRSVSVKIIFWLCCFVQVINGENCQNDWSSVRSCMKSRYAEYSAQLRLNDTARANLENTIRDCYTQQECQDPFPPAPTTAAMRACYSETQKLVRDDIQKCIEKTFNDVVLPEEDPLAYFWMQDEVYVKTADDDNSKLCGPYTNQNSLNTCVTKALEDAFTNPGKSKHMCDVRAECSQRIQPTCLNKWREKVEPKLCTCASDQSKLAKYKNKYRQCVQSRGASLGDLDIYSKYLDNLKARTCGAGNRGQKDPCADYVTEGGGQPDNAATTQDPLSAFFKKLGVGTLPPIDGSGGGGNQVTDALGNLAKLITGSGGTLTGRGANSAGFTNLINSLTGGGSANSNPLGGGSLTSIFSSGKSLGKILGDTPGFGSLKGEGGYGSLLGGKGTGYDFIS